MNSTTGDPNWKGRLIFSLYNASGIEVQLDLDSTFATMVVHEAKSRSKSYPKNPQAVIEKYLDGLAGEDTKRIVGYVLREDEVTMEFKSMTTKVEKLSNLPTPFFQLVLCAHLIFELLAQYWLAALFVSAAVVAWVAPLPNWAPIAGFVSAISAIVTLVVSYKRRALKLRSSVLRPD